MTKSEKHKLIKSLIDKYCERLNLKEWDFEYSLKDQWDNDGAAARIEVTLDYRWAHIFIYQCAFDKANNLDKIIAHELCHVLTEKFYVYAIDFINGRFHSPLDIESEREYLTERISRLIL